ncbi:phenylacetate--CoA ligase family protein [Desulfurivibrio dismutans]|uniref:phenylacetate--CoA ligase family protein n=1 Tax=Desulfurivibrio dismutans TaxID=1398908 RepID=UPI0023D9EF99|nr:AMP-binding protein [Desulfurivibrio alkaliphilus]MDF1614720.1 AMP-binding protein [Desulfurivibrio alkaliphilus]
MQPATELYTLEQGLRLRQASAVEREAVQLAMLRRHLTLAQKAPHYREMFASVGFSPARLDSLTDLPVLPLTSRADIDRSPTSLLPATGLPPVDLALTSGTTGRPVTIPYTAHDLERLAYNEMMAFYGAGVRPGDRALLFVTLDRCFIAGLAYYSGLVRLGAAAIRGGPGKPPQHWELIANLRPTVLVGVPSFLLKLARWGEENGLAPAQSGVTALVTIGEPVRRADMTLTPLGALLQQAWGARLHASYGATEMATAFGECTAGCGGHVHPELMLAEIIDEQGRPVAPGEPGEVVVTPLGVEGFPLVRFRTGDVARLHHEPCPCGWQTPRLGPIEGRLAQRLKYKGTTLYPESIFQVLQEVPGVRDFYLEVSSSYDLSDEIRVVVGGGDISLEKIRDMLQARLRVMPEVVVRPAAEVLAVIESGGSRKVKRFFDLREVAR